MPSQLNRHRHKCEGRFYLLRPKRDIPFQFRFFLKVTVMPASVYNVTMEAAGTGDVPVVMVKAARKNLSSLTTTIKPEDLNKGAIGDVGQLLQGKVAGLNISANGDPTKPQPLYCAGFNHTVRLLPFYVIGWSAGAGYFVIAPDDIASIDVLKDAAANPLYTETIAGVIIGCNKARQKKGQLQTACTLGILSESKQQS